MMKRLAAVLLLLSASIVSAGVPFEHLKWLIEEWSGKSFVFAPSDFQESQSCAHHATRRGTNIYEQEISCAKTKVLPSRLDEECTLPGLMRGAKGRQSGKYCVCDKCDCK